MPLYGPSTATATVTANTNSVSITGMDLNAVVQQGMTINLGARDRAVGDAWIINAVVPNGTNGGTLTTAGTIPTAYNSVPFLIDTRGFNGTDSSFAAAVSLKLLATLTNLLGTATNLFAGSRQLVLDKVASTAIGRIAFAIAGRTWGDIAQRSLTYTPTGGQAATIETVAVRAFPDGATPTDALLFDLGNGTGDLRKGSATMVAGATVDLGSAPMGKVTIAGASNISSFGSGRHLERIVRFADAGATLVHNAASLDLPGGANIAVRAGDRLHATSDGSGNWRVHTYQRADGTSLVLPASTQRASFRNRVRNGAFLTNQRAVGGTITLPAGAYGHDGWKAGPGGCTYTATYTNGIYIVNITSGSLQQPIEGGLYMPEGGSYVLSWGGTAQARFNQGAYSPSPLFAGNVTPGTGLTVEFGTGTLSLVQFEPGAVVTPFEYRDDEWRQSVRYYQRVPTLAAAGIAISSTRILFTGSLPAPLRANPAASLLKTSVASGSFELFCGGQWISGSPSLAQTLVSGPSFNVIADGFSGLTPGNSANWNVSAPFIGLSAEI